MARTTVHKLKLVTINYSPCDAILERTWQLEVLRCGGGRLLRELVAGRRSIPIGHLPIAAEEQNGVSSKDTRSLDGTARMTARVANSSHKW